MQRRERVRQLIVTMGLVACATAAPADERRNVFDDPFIMVTRDLPGCPVPEGPLYSEAEARAAAHDR